MIFILTSSILLIINILLFFLNILTTQRNIIALGITFLGICFCLLLIIELYLSSVKLIKERKYKLLFPLFAFNIFFIPFLKKINKKQIALFETALILNVLCILMLGSNYFKQPISNQFINKTDDSLVSLYLPINYDTCMEDTIYNLECYNSYNNATIMLLNYKLDSLEHKKPQVDLINQYEAILKNKAKNLIEIEPLEVTKLKNKTIYQTVYEGTIDEISLTYLLAVIDFDNNDFLTVSIQLINSHDYVVNKKILINNIYNVTETTKKVTNS